MTMVNRSQEKLKKAMDHNQQIVNEFHKFIEKSSGTADKLPPEDEYAPCTWICWIRILMHSTRQEKEKDSHRDDQKLLS